MIERENSGKDGLDCFEDGGICEKGGVKRVNSIKVG